MIDSAQIASLLFKQLQGTLTTEEQALLDEWLRDFPSAGLLLNELHDEEKLSGHLKSFHPDNWKDTDKRIKTAVDASIRQSITAPVTPRVHFLKTHWFRIAAAVLLLFAAGIYTLLYKIDGQKNTSIQVSKPGVANIVPGGNKAVLTLADGRTIILDSAANGDLAEQGNTKIRKVDAGALAYEAIQTSGSELLYNTIATPRGGQYQVTLPDRTVVWLNAASSVRFPTAFGKQRLVEITGEAYLEVASDKQKPFMLKTPRTTVQVLGTSFNVNAYPDRDADRVSLVDGKVKIASAILKPGEAYTAGTVTVADLSKDLAWKNGIFNFSNKPFRVAMQELANWYDLEIRYQQPVGKIQLFGGTLKRNLPWADMLQFLEGAGLRYRMEGKNKMVILNQ